MIGIDWVAVVVLGFAWALSNVRTIPLYLRDWIFAVACLGVCGYRVARGVQGINLIVAIVAGAIGVQYLVRGFRNRKISQARPPAE
ncbi:MAG: hypothetical protein U0228_12730 [Myxococcaceae bacterium]